VEMFDRQFPISQKYVTRQYAYLTDVSKSIEGELAILLCMFSFIIAVPSIVSHQIKMHCRDKSSEIESRDIR